VLRMCIIVTSLNYTNGDFSPSLPGDWDVTDVLWSWSGFVTTAASLATRLSNTQTISVDVKAQRRLTSDSQIVLVASAPSDAGSPTIAIAPTLRLLVDRI